MFTVQHRGTYIHCYVDRPNCTLNWRGQSLHFNSLRAAKMFIGKKLLTPIDPHRTQH